MSTASPMPTALSGGELDAYLARIGYDGAPSTDLATLTGIHRMHQMTVPFENLDIHLGRRIELDVDRFMDKLVRGGRGGFCFEHNGLLAAALRAIGFDTAMLSARVRLPDGSLTPEFDHMALRVLVGDDAYLADVGFGEFTLEPLRMIPDIEQTDGRSRFKLTTDGETWSAWREDGAWSESYAFTLDAHELTAFAARCDWLQTSPDSLFVQGRICSRATPDGRISVRNDRLITTIGADKSDRELTHDEALAALREHFGIDVPGLRPLTAPGGGRTG